MDVKDFNRLEVDFLAAIDWNVNVPQPEFESALQRIERQIAYRELTRRHFSTYSDLDVLSNTEARVYTLYDVPNFSPLYATLLWNMIHFK